MSLKHHRCLQNPTCWKTSHYLTRQLSTFSEASAWGRPTRSALTASLETEASSAAAKPSSLVINTTTVVQSLVQCQHLITNGSTVPADGPIHVSESVSETAIFVETMHPGSWWQLERSCQSSGGFLISLGSSKLENDIMQSTNLPSFWCGGNMCPDSPGNNIIGQSL